MFEKYDGIRAFWHPGRKLFYSRKGKQLPIPKQIIDTMPTDIFLDGELWCVFSQPYFTVIGTSQAVIVIRFGRDNFEESLRMLARSDTDEADWGKFKYMVFDIPNHKGTYKERYDTLGHHPSPLSSFARTDNNTLLFSQLAIWRGRILSSSM